MVHNSKMQSQSSVIFARFQTSEPLALAKLGKVQNHVHDLAFAQQVAARVLQVGDVINDYQGAMGATDAKGDTFDISGDAAVTVDLAMVAADHQAVKGTLSTENTEEKYKGMRAPTSAAQQPNWDRSSADLSGCYQGRHTLRMVDFLNVFYPAGDAAGQLPQASLSKLRKAKLMDKDNNSGTGPKGWFGVDCAELLSKQTPKDGEKAVEAKQVVLTDINSQMINNRGFNVQSEVMTNILEDLGIDVHAENERLQFVRTTAADALDTVSYIKLSNYLKKHDSLGAIVEDSKISANESMTRGALFYELAKQYDDNNHVHDSERVVKLKATAGDSEKALTSLTKEVKTEVDKNNVAGNAAAQKVLEDAYTDQTAYQSGRVAVAFLYKSQTQGVKDTEIRVHMKLSGGKKKSGQHNPLNRGNNTDADAWPKHVPNDELIGRTWDQMCTPLPLMENGKPVV